MRSNTRAVYHTLYSLIMQQSYSGKRSSMGARGSKSTAESPVVGRVGAQSSASPLEQSMTDYYKKCVSSLASITRALLLLCSSAARDTDSRHPFPLLASLISCSPVQITILLDVYFFLFYKQYISILYSLFAYDEK